MRFSARKARTHAAIWLPLLISALVGCAGFQLPRIDPTGERIFAPGGQALEIAPPPVEVIGPPVEGAPLAAVPLAPAETMPLGPAPAVAAPPMVAAGIGQEGLTLSPSRIVAPVGSQVVMIASVCGGDGYLRTRERVDWTISPECVGQIVAVGGREALDCVNLFRGIPRIVNGRYAINTTVSRDVTLNRGTPEPADDVVVRAGQAWANVTSPIEGTTALTAAAGSVPGRQQTASIYWIDAQWAFPPPAINPVGSKHLFTTTVTRQTSGAPLAGYLVRYEIAGGVDAGFGPGGDRATEVPVNELGQASVEVSQRTPAAGTAQINIQIVRPPQIAGGEQLILGTGSTSKTWTSSDLALRVAGPAQSSVGNDVTYRIELTNPGTVAVRDITISDQMPASLEFVNSTPPASRSPSGQEWKIDQVGPGQTAVIEATFRLMRAGSHSYCARASTTGGLSASGCAVTTAGEPAVTTGGEPAGQAQIELRVTGPATAVVGSEVRFEVEVSNRGTAPASGLLITDRFDPGFEHSASASPIERDLPEIPPGSTHRIGVTFRVTQPGNVCHDVTVTGPGGLRAVQQACTLAVAAQPATPQPAPVVPPVLQPTPATPPAAASPDAGSTTATEPPIAPPAPESTEPGRRAMLVRKSGPQSSNVGEIAEFHIEVTNTGTVALTNVRITDNYELTLEPVQATTGSEQVGGEFVWTVNSLAPGKRVRRQINCRCLQATKRACNRVTVTADNVAKQADEACLEIMDPTAAPAAPQPAPQAASQLYLSVAEVTDPVRSGGEATYQILVTNKGQSSDKQVATSIKFEGLTFQSITSSPVRGAVVPGGVRFEPVAEIRAGETLTFEMRFQAAEPGSARLDVELTSHGHPQPLRAQETTQVIAQ